MQPKSMGGGLGLGASGLGVALSIGGNRNAPSSFLDALEAPAAPSLASPSLAKAPSTTGAASSRIATNLSFDSDDDGDSIGSIMGKQAARSAYLPTGVAASQGVMMPPSAVKMPFDPVSASSSAAKRGDAPSLQPQKSIGDFDLDLNIDDEDLDDLLP
jgi:hypothetical protein